MLLPSLQKARAKAKGISCVNNLKQMALAMITYSAGCDDCIILQQNPNNTFVESYTSVMLKANVLERSEKAVRCPENRTRKDLASNLDAQIKENAYGTNGDGCVGIDGYWHFEGGSTNGISLSPVIKQNDCSTLYYHKMTNPSEFIISACSRITSDEEYYALTTRVNLAHCGANAYSSLAWAIHDRTKVNMSYGDGHVEPTSRDQHAKRWGGDWCGWNGAVPDWVY